jgi:hypothetical protein
MTGTVLANGAGGYLHGGDRVSIVRSRFTGGLVEATTGGAATGRGAGLEVRDAAVAITRSRVSGNQIKAAGGTGAGTARGGGLLAIDTVSVGVTKTTVAGNVAHAQGAGGTESTGGGIEVSGTPAKLRLRASTVSGNLARAPGAQARGGGLLLDTGGPYSLVNSTVAGNRVTGNTARGGGIDSAAALTLTNATVARNAAKIGGGLYVEQGTATLRGSILGLNTAPDGPDCSQNVASAGRNLVAKTSGCSFAAKQTDKRNRAPKLGKLRSRGGPTKTISLLSGSPALNAIPKAACAVTRDQRGVKRPQGRRCDIGAFERKR